jgi:SPP1 family predicted phage head-tail adaptor
LNSATGTPVGKLRHRVTLQQPVDTDDGAGGTTRTWSEVATLWARIEPMSADERVAAERIEAAADTRITIRWRAGVTSTMRFSFGTRVFEIRGLTDREERHRFLDCLCEEPVS